MTQIKTPLTWYGGKQRMVKYLLPLIPKHKVYIEPFFGGGSLFFAKTPAKLEVINDNNGEVVNFFKMVQSKFHSLGLEVRKLNYGRKTFFDALVIYTYPHLFDEMQRACAMYILANQSYSGCIRYFGTSVVGNCAKTFLNKTEKCFTGIELQKRFAQTILENEDVLKMIERYDSNDSLFYFDPPYVNARCEPYRNPYTWSDYEALLDKISKMKGKFILTSYPNAQLKEAIKNNGWHFLEVERAINTNHQKSLRKIEIIATNFPIPDKFTELEAQGLFEDESKS